MAEAKHRQHSSSSTCWLCEGFSPLSMTSAILDIRIWTHISGCSNGLLQSRYGNMIWWELVLGSSADFSIPLVILAAIVRGVFISPNPEICIGFISWIRQVNGISRAQEAKELPSWPLGQAWKWIFYNLRDYVCRSTGKQEGTRVSVWWPIWLLTCISFQAEMISYFNKCIDSTPNPKLGYSEYTR